MGRKPGKRDRNRTPLDKHRRDGSRLDPPFATMPGMTPSSWLDDILPDMLWAALIVDGLEREYALDVFRGLGHAVDDDVIVLPDGRITHSALAQSLPHAASPVGDLLREDPEVAAALSPLRLLPGLPARDVWETVAAPLESDEEGWVRLASAVATSFNHQSQAATDCRWMMVLAMLVSGKLHMGSEEIVPEILEYPSRGDIHKVRPTIRATEMALRGERPSEWPDVFWRFCLDSTECGPFSNYSPSPTGVEVGLTSPQLERLTSQIRDAFWVTMEHTRVDVRRDAVFGLCAYSAALLAEMMRPAASTAISARSSLRTLTEIAITLAYLVKKDDPDVWQQFRNYGTGKAKLSYMKQERQPSPSFVDTESLEALANEDYWEEFTSIELGHWRGKDLRRLAEATGTKDLYDTYYDWTSHHGHGHWGAVRESQFVVCMNPLHRFHRVLADSTLPLGDIIPDAAIVMDRILELVRRAYPDARIDPLSAAVGDDPGRV